MTSSPLKGDSQSPQRGRKGPETASHQSPSKGHPYLPPYRRGAAAARGLLLLGSDGDLARSADHAHHFVVAFESREFVSYRGSTAIAQSELGTVYPPGVSVCDGNDVVEVERNLASSGQDREFDEHVNQSDALHRHSSKIRSRCITSIRPGVVVNFAPFLGTGAGGFVQDMTELEILG